MTRYLSHSFILIMAGETSLIEHTSDYLQYEPTLEKKKDSVPFLNNIAIVFQQTYFRFFTSQNKEQLRNNFPFCLGIFNSDASHLENRTASIAFLCADRKRTNDAADGLKIDDINGSYFGSVPKQGQHRVFPDVQNNRSLLRGFLHLSEILRWQQLEKMITWSKKCLLMPPTLKSVGLPLLMGRC